jgi:hypothetical protein
MTIIVILVMLAMFVCGQQHERAKHCREPFEPHRPRFLGSGDKQ